MDPVVLEEAQQLLSPASWTRGNISVHLPVHVITENRNASKTPQDVFTKTVPVHGPQTSLFLLKNSLRRGAKKRI